MAGGIDWFRWHHGSVTDPKFQLVARKAGASLPDVIAIWAYLLEQASASSERGGFGEIDAEALDCLFNFPNTETRTADVISAMEQRGLIAGGHIVAWEKRQPKREREEPKTSTDRVRAFRDRQRQSEEEDANPNHETPRNAKKEQETPRGEESRVEENTPSLRSGERRGSRLPADWELPDDWRSWAKAERPDLDPANVAAKFSDHWHSKPGAAGRKLDWQATWRNWVREERAAATTRVGPKAQSFAEQDREVGMRRWEEQTGRVHPDRAPSTTVFDALPADMLELPP